MEKTLITAFLLMVSTISFAKSIPAQHLPKTILKEGSTIGNCKVASVKTTGPKGKNTLIKFTQGNKVAEVLFKDGVVKSTDYPATGSTFIDTYNNSLSGGKKIDQYVAFEIKKTGNGVKAVDLVIESRKEGSDGKMVANLDQSLNCVIQL